MKHYYKIHDLKFELDISDPIPWMFHKLSFFKVDKFHDTPNLKIIVGPFNCKIDSWANFDHTFYSNGNDMFFTNTWKGFQWKTAWYGINSDRITVKFDYNKTGILFFPWLMYLDWVLFWFIFKPCTELIWSRMQKYIIHASACSIHGNGYMFTGYGSGLKTSYAMNLVNSGFDFLGDDQILIDSNSLNCMPVSLNTFAFRTQYLRDEYLTPLRLVRMAYYHFFPIPRKFNVAESCNLKQLYVVIRAKSKNSSISEISESQAVSHTVFNCKNETLVKIHSRYPIYAPFIAMDTLFPDFNHERIWDGLRKALGKLYKNKSCYLIQMGPKWDNHNMDLLNIDHYNK